jgi:Holliday junction resolvase
MATTPESKVKTKIKAILKAHGAYYAMPIGSGYGSSGVPDFLCCLNGEFLAIEAKAGNGTTTALQDQNLREIGDAGGRALIINEESLRLGILEAVLENMK